MKRKILPLTIILTAVVMLSTVYCGAETAAASSGIVIGLVIAVILEAAFGIIVPALATAFSLIKIFKAKDKYPILYYIAFVGSVIWLVAGIILMVLLLI